MSTSFKELKSKLDTHIGIESTAKFRDDNEAKLVYASKTGVVLFELTVANFGDVTDPEWRFGGQSSALPNEWATMCKITG